MKTRLFFALGIFGGLLALGAGAQLPGKPAAAAPQWVVLDTDIGDDIDDAFALGLLLESPEVKLLGVVSAYGDTELRARLLDRYLHDAGRAGVPVMAGVQTKASNVFSQAAYAKRARTRTYEDGVDFLLKQAAKHPGQVTLVAIGPLTNIQTAIGRDPEGFKKLKRVVIMAGSIERGYDGEKGERRPPDPEWNVVCDPAGLRALLGSGVPVFMMPLDSTQIHLEQKARERIFATGSPVTDQIALLYHQWANSTGNQNPTLFDPVAAAFTLKPELCPVKPMHLEVDEKGYTRPAEGQPNAQVCLASDERGFLEFLESRLAGKTEH